MINASNEFNRLMTERTNFTENAEITFLDGTVIELTEKDFTTSNNAIIDGAGSNSLPVGVAICRNIHIELDNHDDRFSTYDFFGARIRLYLTFALSDSVERIEEGIFTVNEPETYGETVIISAVDDMYKANKNYSTNLPFPATAGEVLRDVCSYCDIPLLSTSFENDDFVIETKPDADIPCRQIIGYIAMISGGNARINRQGQFEIIYYNASAFDKDSLDGGKFQPWNEGVYADGGSFSPWDIGYKYDGGNFTDKYPYHILGYWRNIKVDTDDVVVTGVSIKSGEETYLSGVEGYVLSFDNPLVTGKEQEVVDFIGQKLIGLKFRKFDGDLVSNPLIEFMDPALIIDRKGNIYQTYITDVDFNFFGFTVLKNSAENALRNSSQYYSDAIKTLVEAKKLIEKEKTDREVAIENLASQLATSSGLYMTIEQQEDESNIYYMHDKPTLAESMIVWKLTSLAFGISTDGGKTYPYGFTVDGQTITRLLYAEGINADYIDSGTIDADKINVINVVAKSVAAENISGEEIIGKKFTSNILIGDWNTETSIDGGRIRSEVVGGSSSLVGAYVQINAPNIEISSSNMECNIDYSKISFSAAYGTLTSELTYSKLNIGGSSAYSELTNNELTIYASYSNKAVYGSDTIDFYRYGTITADYLTLGGSSDYLGFFGGSKRNMQISISTITTPSTATTSTIATKLNELIDDLKKYGLLE